MKCVATVRSGEGNRIVDVQKFVLIDGPTHLAALADQSRTITQRAVANYWRDATHMATVAKPLPVAINDETLQGRDGWSWPETDTRLRIMRAEHPDDPAIKMMWATHLHAKYVAHGTKLFRTGTATCAEDEAEIEKLVLESLDFTQNRPEYAVMAAKLLYFVDHGYRDLALDLAKNAHREDSSLTSTLSILGQLLGFTGDTEAAETYLRQAVELSDHKSREQVYVLYMLIQLHTAVGDRDKQSAALKRLYRINPLLIAVFDLYFTDPTTPSMSARAMTRMMKPAQATATLRNAAYLSARLYADPRHRENVLRAPVNLFVKRFGPSVVPDEAAIHLPSLVRP